MITSEREAWLWVHDFIDLYMVYDGETGATLIDRCRIHHDRTKLQEGSDLSLKAFCFRVSGICGVLSLMVTHAKLSEGRLALIEQDMWSRMRDRMEKHAGGEILGYLFPCTPEGKIKRLALCKKFAAECEA